MFYTKHYWFPAALPPLTTLDAQAWWSLQQQPPQIYRQNRIGQPVELLNVQWAGELKTIETTLTAEGWEVVPKPDTAMIINRIAAKNRFEQLPLFPQFYLHRKAVLIMTKRVGHPERLLVLRLWDPNIRVTDIPLWVGTIGYHEPWTLKSKNSSLPIMQPAIDVLTRALSTLFIWQSVPASSMQCSDCQGHVLLIKPVKGS